MIEPILEHPEDEIYIGSTTKQYLSQRMDSHRNSYKRWQNGNANKVQVYDLFNKYGIENCKILLLETVNAKSKDELTAREGFYIKNTKCLNKRIEGRTQKEYVNDNKEIISAKKSLYRNQNKHKLKLWTEANKEKLQTYRKDYYNNNKKKLKTYYDENKDKIKSNRKEYYQLNKLKLSEKVLCDVCNCHISKRKFNCHQQTLKHQNNLTKLH